ncbi:hypothetical protein AAHE18_07G159100 [Arachis hypogaea]|nr:uncharacterized protein DS421_7g216970 [Arachis hypogaea]
MDYELLPPFFILPILDVSVQMGELIRGVHVGWWHKDILFYPLCLTKIVRILDRIAQYQSHGIGVDLDQLEARMPEEEDDEVAIVALLVVNRCGISLRFFPLRQQ